MRKGSGLRAALQAATAVGWSFAVMAAVAALGLHLLGADRYARLGAMTAAVVALGTGGSVTPTGSAEVFGASGIAGAQTSLDIMPLGVTLAGAAVLGWLFLRPLRGRAVLPLGELALRAATAAVCLLAVLGLLCWAGQDRTTLDINQLTGNGGSKGSGGGNPLGDLGDLGGLGDLLDPGKLGGAIGGIAKPKAVIGFSVDTAPTVGGGLLWLAVVLLLALAVSRRAPLPHGWQALHRTVRPAASALWTVLLGTALVGAAAAAVLPLTQGSSPSTAAGAALLGTPNGIGLAAPVALGVPVTAQADGALVHAFPAPLDQLLKAGTAQHLTVGRLMQLDGSLWVLPVAFALLLLLAGVLTAVRTPAPPPAAGPRPGAAAEAARCAARLGPALGLGLLALLWLSEVAVGADLSVFGFDAYGAKATVSGSLLLALVYGVLWGAVAGSAGALLVRRFAAAKRPAEPAAYPEPGAPLYGGLPLSTAAPAPAEAANPYRSAGAQGFNPYSGGPAGPPPPAPPPPPTPPGRPASG